MSGKIEFVYIEKIRYKRKINGQEEFFQSSLAIWVHGNHYYYCCYGYHHMGYVLSLAPCAISTP